MYRILIALLTLTVGVAQAQTLRWAAQGDLQTLDPHSQNELMTNSLNNQIYEHLVRRLRDQTLGPSLATEWTQVNPLLWRVKLRAGVKFHDGSPFGAQDVLFSMQRLRDANSPFRVYANAVGTPRAVDPLTVEFTLTRPNPIFAEHLNNLMIMSKRWCEQNRVTRPLNFKENEDSFANLNANGTGPFMLASRQPGVKTTYKRNPDWWGRGAPDQGNVQEFSFVPIANDATRTAALITGEIDLVLDPPSRDIDRLRRTAGLKVVDGPENRLIFLGVDQTRDSLLHGKSPDGKNPFKDVRVRRALYHAIDIETIKTKLMAGYASPTGGLTPSALGAYNDPTLENRLPFDLAAARKLMAEAGYGNGFEVTLDCPNNRYVNDEKLCVAVASMWAQLKVKVRVNALPRTLFFPKVEKQDTSLYLAGWGGGTVDAEVMLTPVLRNRGEQGVGVGNYSGIINDKADALAAASSVETDPVKRELLIKAALQAYREQANLIPLHRQVIPWAMKSGISVPHSPANWLSVDWVQVAPK